MRVAKSSTLKDLARTDTPELIQRFKELKKEHAVAIRISERAAATAPGKRAQRIADHHTVVNLSRTAGMGFGVGIPVGGGGLLASALDSRDVIDFDEKMAAVGAVLSGLAFISLHVRNTVQARMDGFWDEAKSIAVSQLSKDPSSGVTPGDEELNDSSTWNDLVGVAKVLGGRAKWGLSEKPTPQDLDRLEVAIDKGEILAGRSLGDRGLL